MRTLRNTLLASVAALVAACSSLPEVQVPAPALPHGFSQAHGLPQQAANQQSWWLALDDPVLSQLIERGLQSNLDLVQAGERVQRSRALAAGSRAALGPSGSVRAQASKAQASAHEAPGLSSAQRRVETASVGLDLQWEADLFGRLRTQSAAAGARVQVSEAQAAALRLAVSAEIAQAYFAWIGEREQLQVTQSLIENRRATVDLVQRRARGGMVAPIDDARARADLAATEADVPLHEAAAAVATHRLAVLLGTSPSEFQLPPQRGVDPARVPVAVPEPSQWLAQRPDIAEAEAALRAHALDVAAIRAEFMPRVSVTGLLAFVAGSATGLGSAASASWFVAPAVSLPVFDYGRIDARLVEAKAQQREALAAYSQRILLALEEVESSLARYRQAQLQLGTLHQRSIHSTTAERLARVRYEAGAGDLLELLDAQRSARQAQAALAQGLALQRQHLVAVLRALGTAA
ncbi:MAG: efflux transporter outer membrane subunit [Burkholderiaceae bacterium]|nr:efflux transporter outer membrane subunit [Burkholderiaceae bacterium]